MNGTAATGGGSSSYDQDGTFTIGLRTDWTENQTATESGLASSTLVRTTAGYTSADTCGSFGSPTTLVGTPAQNGLTTGCYRYTLTGTDNVGNTTTITTTVKVDTSDPAAPSLSFSAVGGGAYYPGSGSRVYFKPDAANGTFDISASSTDADTGIASYSFPAGSALGTNWAGSGSGSSRTYSYTATATSNGSQNVTATNNAGRSANSNFTPTADSTAPAGGALSVNGTAATGGGSSSYDQDGTFTIGLRTDWTENQTATESGLASSTLVRTTASYTSADTCGSFGSPTTLVGTPAQNGLTTGCYRYTLTGTDNVGNTTTITTTVKVDTDAPTVSLNDPGTPVAGTISVAASASDSSTGVQQVVFQRSPAGAGTWTTIGSADTTAPYGVSWDTTAIADGLYDLRAVATDTAGNSDTSVVANRRVDNTAPVTSLDSGPGNPDNDTTPTFTFSSNEPGSTFECRVDGGAWTACTSPFTLARPRRRQPHLRRPRHGRGGEHRRHAGERHLDDRPDGAGDEHRLHAGASVERHDPDVHVQLRQARLDLRVPRRRRQLDGLHHAPSPSPPHSAPAATPSTSAPPTRAATPTRRRLPTPGRSTSPPRSRARHDAGASVERHHPDVHVQLQRARLDLRVPHRRRLLDDLHQPLHLARARRRQPHLRRPRHRPGRQHRCHPRRATPGRST